MGRGDSVKGLRLGLRPIFDNYVMLGNLFNLFIVSFLNLSKVGINSNVTERIEIISLALNYN